MRRAAGAAMAALALACAPLAAQVALRSQESVDAPVVDASLAGLRVGPASAGGAPRLIGWDRVKSVEGADGPKAAKFATTAEMLWRARTRVERGDFAAAEPLLDGLAQSYAGEEGPSAAVVAECLVRCRLARGAQGAATSAWLWWTWLMEQKSRAAKGAPAWIGGSVDLPPLMDAQTGLVPGLPPIWAPGSSTQAVATSPEWPRLRARGGVAASLALLYEKAARFEAGLDGEISLAEQESKEPAVAIVRDIVLARGGSAESREAARKSIRQRLSSSGSRQEPGKSKATPMPTWLEAWLQLGLGQSLIRESDENMRVRGVIELLNVPARFGAEQPNLAGIALADAAVVMAELGDADAAAALKGELIAHFPLQPAAQWEKLSAIKGAQGGGRSSEGE